MALGRHNPGVFTYFGSKRNISNIIATKLDTGGGPFCEVFAGGAFVTLRLASWGLARHVWLNDLDPGIASLWKVIATERLVRKLLPRLPYATTRALHRKCVEQLRAARVDVETADEDTLLDLAWMKAVTLWSSYMGISTNYGPTKFSNRQNIRTKILRGHEILRRVDVRVTNWDCGRVLDSAGQYSLYLDPPYYGVRGAYLKDFRDRQHLVLALRLFGRKGWLLSYDDCRAIRTYYHWARIDTLTVPYRSGMYGRELLISPKS